MHPASKKREQSRSRQKSLSDMFHRLVNAHVLHQSHRKNSPRPSAKHVVGGSLPLPFDVILSGAKYGSPSLAF